jgi:hypothetical protein
MPIRIEPLPACGRDDDDDDAMPPTHTHTLAVSFWPVSNSSTCSTLPNDHPSVTAAGVSRHVRCVDGRSADVPKPAFLRGGLTDGGPVAVTVRDAPRGKSGGGCIGGFGWLALQISTPHGYVAWHRSVRDTGWDWDSLFQLIDCIIWIIVDIII